MAGQNNNRFNNDSQRKGSNPTADNARKNREKYHKAVEQAKKKRKRSRATKIKV